MQNGFNLLNNMASAKIKLFQKNLLILFESFPKKTTALLLFLYLPCIPALYNK